MRNQSYRRMAAWVCTASMLLSTLSAPGVMAAEEVTAQEESGDLYAGAEMLEEIAAENTQIISGVSEAESEPVPMQQLDWTGDETETSDGDLLEADSTENAQDTDQEAFSEAGGVLFDDPEAYDAVDEELEAIAAEGFDDSGNELPDEDEFLEDEIAEVSEELAIEEETEEATEESGEAALEDGYETAVEGIVFVLRNTDTGWEAWAEEYDGDGGIIDIPDQVTFEDEDAQDGTPAVTVPVTRIDDRAFEENEDITSVIIPYTVREIGDGAFNECENLESVSFAENSELEVIGDEAFAYSDIKAISLPDTITEIGFEAFSHSSLAGEIIIPADVTVIKDGTFEGTRITGVTIPASVSVIESWAFNNCMSLENVTFKEGSILESIGDYAFSGDRALKSIAVPENVSFLGEAAFARTGLESFEMPASLTEIPDELLTGSNIQSVIIPSRVERIGNGAFESCRKLTDVAVRANNLTEIGDWAFAYAPITSFPMPETVTSIGSLAFAYTKLETVDIPDRVTEIKEGTFTRANLKGTLSIKPGITSIGSSAFADNVNLTAVVFENEASISSIGPGAFSGCDLKSFTVPSALTEVPVGLLRNNSNLTKVIYAGNNITKIGSSAFSGTGLTSLELPAKVTEIPANAYSYSALKTVNIPATVTAIQYAAFAGCTSLTDVSFASGSNVAEIPRAAFYGNEKLASVVLPDTVKTIGKNAFEGTKALKTIRVSSNVNKIEEFAIGYLRSGKKPVLLEGFSIRGMRNTAAEAYAKENKITFIPEDPYLSLNVGRNTIPLAVKKSFTATVTDIYPGDRVVSWSTSNARAAVVDNTTGKVTGRKVGTAVITAKTAYGAEASFKVQVKLRVPTKKITQVPKKQTLKKGQKLTLSPVLTPFTSSDKLTYKSSNKKIVKVTKKGVIKARKKGKAVITVTSGKKSVKIRITVK